MTKRFQFREAVAAAMGTALVGTLCFLAIYGTVNDRPVLEATTALVGGVGVVLGYFARGKVETNG